MSWQPQPPPQHPQQGAWVPPVPGAIPPPSADDTDLAQLSPFIAKVAAALVAIAGLCAVLGTLQTWTTIEMLEEWTVSPVIDGLLGLALIVVATRLVGARRWAAIVAMVISALLTLASGVWCAYSLSIGFYAVFVLVAPPMSLAGTIVAAIAIGACDRADKARDRLSAQGLDLGL